MTCQIRKLTATPQGIMADGLPLTKQVFDTLPLQSKRYVLRAAELLREVKKEDWNSRAPHSAHDVPMLAKARMMVALAQPMTPGEFYKYNYNPNEPRIPAGQPGAGQWTAGDGTATGAGSISADDVRNNPTDTITQVGSYTPVAYTTNGDTSTNATVATGNAASDADEIQPTSHILDDTEQYEGQSIS